MATPPPSCKPLVEHPPPHVKALDYQHLGVWKADADFPGGGRVLMQKIQIPEKQVLGAEMRALGPARLHRAYLGLAKAMQRDQPKLTEQQNGLRSAWMRANLSHDFGQIFFRGAHLLVRSPSGQL